jgi:hypothetical protein
MSSFAIKLAQGLMTLIGNPTAEPVILGFFGLSLLILASGLRRRPSLTNSTGMCPGRTEANTPIVHPARTDF